MIPKSGLRFSEKIIGQKQILPDFAVLQRRRML